MAGTGGRREGAGRKKGQLNKSKLEVKELLEQIIDFEQIFIKLGELSMDGNPVAARLLCEYRYGKAPQSIDLTSGGKEIKQNIIKLADGTEIII